MSTSRRLWRPGRPVDLLDTLGSFRHGRGDPTIFLDRLPGIDQVWLGLRTPEGPATLCLRARGWARPWSGSRVGSLQVAAGVEAEVAAEAGGPGAEWALGSVPDLLGARDEPAGFDPAHPRLREVAARHPGLRVPRGGRVLEALVPAVLEQKVTGLEAHRSWRELVQRFGSPAPPPAPPGLRVPPDAETWAALPSWQWHRAGVDENRARTIRAAARVASRLEETLDMPPAEADRRLRAVPGVGPWTSAEVRQRAHGDPDAVSVGDYNLPAVVGVVLTGEPVDDEGMLALLVPWAGHRYRVTRLAELSGARPRRHAPRAPLRDFRRL